MRFGIMVTALMVLVGCATHRTVKAVSHAAPKVVAPLVDDPEYVQQAVETMRPYIDDTRMAQMEIPQIDQCERDVYDLQDGTLTTSIASRRKKLDDDIKTLYDRDQMLQMLDQNDAVT
jgi:hypothetical protein